MQNAGIINRHLSVMNNERTGIFLRLKIQVPDKSRKSLLQQYLIGFTFGIIVACRLRIFRTVTSP